MLEISAKTRELQGIGKDNIPIEVIAACKPVVFKGLAAGWPLVKTGIQSNRAIIDYLGSFYNGNLTIVNKLEPEKKGRLFYNQNLTELDYVGYKGRVDEVLEAIYKNIGADHPEDYYIASNTIDTHFPGMRKENDLTIPRNKHPEADDETVSIWIGSKTIASCHYDALDNLACCVAGRRRFTLFPPDQVCNLYPGPLSPTPGGQVISLVDFHNPDFVKFPRFREAIQAAQVAELEPGDALYLPSMWWHHVEGLMPLNILINYWWNDAPRYLTSGMNALYMAMLGIRDKSGHEREGWKQLFEHYIFNGAEGATRNIPSEARGFLNSLNGLEARRLRAFLINKLNR